MQRYFVEQQNEAHNEFIITGDNARHISKVMRMVVGDEVIIVQQNTANICEITNIAEQVTVKKTGETIASPEMPVKIHIACGLPKGDKLELIAQKATELGMHALLPFAAERSIVKWDAKKGDKKTERLQKIAKEAAEQSHRTHIPAVKNPVSLKQLLQATSEYDIVFIADEEEAKQAERVTFKQVLQATEAKTMLLVFGPEGGLDRSETEALQAAGAKTMSLGPRILRAETAPLYALAAISYEVE